MYVDLLSCVLSSIYGRQQRELGVIRCNVFVKGERFEVSRSRGVYYTSAKLHIITHNEACRRVSVLVDGMFIKSVMAAILPLNGAWRIGDIIKLS